MARSIFFILLAAFSQAGCASRDSDDAIDWYFQVAAPKHYHAWVEHLEFEKSGIGHWRQAPGYIACCWDQEGGPTGKGGRLDLFPDYIAIQWISFAEEKIYQKLIIVQPEWREVMSNLAAVNTSEGQRFRPRNVLTLGLAPGGQIVIWMKGQVGNEVELTRLQANEIGGSVEGFRGLIEQYRLEKGEYLSRHGIPLNGW